MYFTREDKEYAVKFHAEFAGAVAKAVIEGERREIERGVRTVHVAAYTHRYGTDLSVFTTGREALRALGDIATSQCARDPVLRGSVIEAFGRWPAQGMNEDELAALCDAWPRFTNGEQLWVSECPLEFEAARRRDRAFMRPPEGDPEFNDEVACETHGVGVDDLGAHPFDVHSLGIHDDKNASKDATKDASCDHVHPEDHGMIAGMTSSRATLSGDTSSAST